MAKRYDTIVIGAGAAGLAAARQLVRAGLEVYVLEAGTRVGGRIFTAFPAGRALPAELGAEFRFWEEGERTGPRTGFIQTPACAFDEARPGACAPPGGCSALA